MFTNRAITNLSHVRLPDDTGQINATFFRHHPILYTERVRAFAIGLLAPFLAHVQVDKPITYFGQVPTRNFYEYLMASGSVTGPRRQYAR